MVKIPDFLTKNIVRFQRLQKRPKFRELTRYFQAWLSVEVKFVDFIGGWKSYFMPIFTEIDVREAPFVVRR